MTSFWAERRAYLWAVLVVAIVVFFIQGFLLDNDTCRRIADAVALIVGSYAVWTLCALGRRDRA